MKTIKRFVSLGMFLLPIIGMGQLSNVIKIKISNATYSDETIIRLANGATVNFDGNYDAWKLFGTNQNVPNIYTKTVAGSYDLSINGLPEFDKDTTIAVYTNIPSAGNYTVEVTVLGAFSSQYQMSIKDINSGLDYLISNNFSFTSNLNPQNQAVTFEVYIASKNIVTPTPLTCYNTNDGVIEIYNKGNFNWNYFIKDSLNNIVSSGTSTSEKAYIYNLPNSTYYIETSANGVTEHDTVKIDNGIQVIADIATSSDTFLLSNSEAQVTFNNNSLNATDFLWDYDNGNIDTSIIGQTSYNSEGTYQVSLTAFNGNCQATTFKTIYIVNPVVTSIEDKNPINTANIYFANNALHIDNVNNIKNISLIDLSGKTIWYNTSIHTNQIEINQNIATGIYLAKITLEDNQTVVKKIKIENI
ncbi:MAG: hypothetical protein Kow0079_00280 [Vicingaceae bacterium]